MLKSRIISDLIKIVEETHTNKFISSEELKHPEDKYTDEFIEEVKYLGSIRIIEINRNTSEFFPRVRLISEGNVFYADFIANYDEIYEVIIDYIKN